jgi:hypothetical protein
MASAPEIAPDRIGLLSDKVKVVIRGIISDPKVNAVVDVDSCDIERGCN